MSETRTNRAIIAATEDGFRAWYDGVALRDCPYGERDLKRAWAAGWFRARGHTDPAPPSGRDTEGSATTNHED